MLTEKNGPSRSFSIIRGGKPGWQKFAADFDRFLGSAPHKKGRKCYETGY